MPFRRFRRDRGTAHVSDEPEIEKKEAPQECLVYTVREAAALLGIDKHNFYNFVKKGDIPSVRLGRKILIPKTAAIFQSLREGTGGVNAISTP
jgi:excisionase family DNA binding protein